jgi:transposase-like protein
MARLLLNQVLEAYETKAPKTMAILKAGFKDPMAVLICRKSTASVSVQPALARLNEEIRRRERVIRIFPNRESAKRLMGALLMEIDEKWEAAESIWIWTAIWSGVNPRT